MYGEITSGSNPDRTILFYNHYDVQPAEPLDLWTHPPFDGVIKDGRVYGRGAADDKGELATRVGAVRTLLESGDPPCNIKFAIEGRRRTAVRAYPPTWRSMAT